MAGTRINVGCGPTPTAGWLNLDNSLTVVLAKRRILRQLASKLGFITIPDFPEIVRRYDIRHVRATSLPLRDATVEVIYSSHMIEHLDRLEAKGFLLEAFRVLEPRGILRLVIPDLSLLVSHYLATGDADTFMERSFLGRSRNRGWKARLRHMVVGHRDHMWMYDSVSISKLMADVGFTEIVVLGPGCTTITDPEPLNLCERSCESAYVEARKPLT